MPEPRKEDAAQKSSFFCPSYSEFTIRQISSEINPKVGAMSTIQNVITGSDELSLDIRVVEEGDAVDALLCSTDNGCDTQKQGDC
jgi:FxLD family lantipeptide